MFNTVIVLWGLLFISCCTESRGGLGPLLVAEGETKAWWGWGLGEGAMVKTFESAGDGVVVHVECLSRTADHLMCECGGPGQEGAVSSGDGSGKV